MDGGCSMDFFWTFSWGGSKDGNDITNFPVNTFLKGNRTCVFSLNQEGIAFSLMFSLQSFCVCVRHARERYIYLPEFLLLDGKLVGKYTNPMATSQDIIRYCLSKNTQTFPHLSSTRDRSWRDEEKRRCVLGIPEMKACDRWTVDRLPSLGRSTWLKEPCGHAHVPDIFWGGESEDVTEFGRVVFPIVFLFELFPDRILQETCHRMVQRNSWQLKLL